MGFNFSFFGRQEHRVFNYRPRFYDPEKEERKQMFGHVDGTSGKRNMPPGRISREVSVTGHIRRPGRPAAIRE